MNASKLFSIIIPIYNVEKYIESCLKSIYTQNIDESLYEVITINDGTPDKSMDIVNNFAKLHNNLKIFNKKNEGVSIARNIGIKNAIGKYLIFIDADDTIEENSLNRITNELIKRTDDAEIFILKSMKTESLEAYPWKKLFIENQAYTGINIFKSKYFRGSVCGCIFDKEFILSHNIEFPKYVKNSEDTIFFALCQIFAKRIFFIDECFYKINIRENSASRMYQINKITNFHQSLNYLNNIITQSKDILNDNQLGVLQYTKYTIILNGTIYATKSSANYQQTKELLKAKQYLPIKYKTLTWGRTKIKILNFSYKLFYYLIGLKHHI